MSPLPQRAHSPPPPPRREEDRDRFSRANFGPVPKRHDADLISAGGVDTYIPPPMEPVRHREPFPVRERDIIGGAPAAGREFREERGGRGDDRGRRPPPHWEEELDRPKRRRSPSPNFPSHRTRRFSPEPHPHSTFALPDPASLPHQLTFKQFADWFRANHPNTAKADEEEFRQFKAGALGADAVKERVGMGKRYERYRKEYTSRQLYSLYLMHRSSPWFTERYSNLPEDVAERKRINQQGRVPNVEKYIAELKAGKHDGISYDQSDDQPKRHAGSRRYSELEEPEGLDRGLGESVADETGRLEIPPLPNQIFVKSVPPTISRKDLEQLFASCKGFQYLAITEPSVKKAFHRVAWAQYAEGTDVEAVVKKLDESKIAGFVFHMGINTAGTIGRLRYAPPISSSLERLLKDGEKAKALALKLEDELVEPKTEAEADVQMKEEGKGAQENGGKGVAKTLKERGSVAVQEVLDRVLDTEGFVIIDEMSEEQKVKHARISLDHWISYLRHGLSTCYYCVSPTAFTEELQRKCVGHLRSPAAPQAKDPGLDLLLEETPDVGMEGDEGVKEEKRAGGKEGEGNEDRREQTGGERERPSRNTRDRAEGGNGRHSQDERWEENLDAKLGQALGGVDAVEYGGRDIEEETKKLTAPLIKQEEANKYRCKECSKLFKAPEFVMKHIIVKHGEGVQAKLDDFGVFNNFVLDPQRLQPTQQVPAAIDDELPQLASAGVPLLNPSLAFNPDLMPGAGSSGSQQQQQQMMLMMMQMQQAMMMQMQANGGSAAGARGMGAEGRNLADRVGGYAGGYSGARGEKGAPAVAREPLPAPPPGAEDPRARKGRVSYMDLDEMGAGAAGGGGGLPY